MKTKEEVAKAIGAYMAENGVVPPYAKCTIDWGVFEDAEDDKEENAIIKLSFDGEDNYEDDRITYYADGMEDFLDLFSVETTNADFIIIDCEFVEEI